MKLNMTGIKTSITDNILYHHAAAFMSVETMIEMLKKEKFINKKQVLEYLTCLMDSPIACNISNKDILLLELYIKESLS